MEANSNIGLLKLSIITIMIPHKHGNKDILFLMTFSILQLVQLFFIYVVKLSVEVYPILAILQELQSKQMDSLLHYNTDTMENLCLSEKNHCQ